MLLQVLRSMNMYHELYPVTYYFYPLLQKNGTDPQEKALFLSTLDEEAPLGTEALLYVHIPYCHDLCRFCPFHVRADSGPEIYHAYTQSLIQEIKLLAQKKRVASLQYKAIYFGGGSPSIFPLNDIKDIFCTIQQEFNLHPDVEISFEGEPRTLGNLELLHLLKEFNVSRVSFGVQTFDSNLRSQFNIVATLDDVHRCSLNAKKVGFSDINVDMMYDLPGQTIPMLERDLHHLAQYEFDSVDYYNLHYYAFPQKFKTMMAKGEIPKKPTQAMHFALTEQLRASMGKMGYHYVADQVFSKSTTVCEYFRLLWGGGYGRHSAETIAVGSSARGYVDGRSYMNHGNVNKYMSALSSMQLPLEKVSDPLINPENRGAVFMMKFMGISSDNKNVLNTLADTTLAQWIEHGLMYENSSGIYITERGKNWTTNMMLDAFELPQKLLAEESCSHLSEKPGIRTGSF